MRLGVAMFRVNRTRGISWCYHTAIASYIRVSIPGFWWKDAEVSQALSLNSQSRLVWGWRRCDRSVRHVAVIGYL